MKAAQARLIGLESGVWGVPLEYFHFVDKLGHMHCGYRHSGAEHCRDASGLGTRETARWDTPGTVRAGKL